jgi:hypothetical protein
MAISAGKAEDGSMQAVLADQSVDQSVEQRQTERQELSQFAIVSVVGTPARVLQAEIRNLSQGGTQIRLGEPLPPFTLVRIEYADNLLLGEVIYCRQEQCGWLVGLRVEHGLFGLTALADTMQAF